MKYKIVNALISIAILLSIGYFIYLVFSGFKKNSGHRAPTIFNHLGEVPYVQMKESSDNDESGF